jgi:hypothetical protein
MEIGKIYPEERGSYVLSFFYRGKHIKVNFNFNLLPPMGAEHT